MYASSCKRGISYQQLSTARDASCRSSIVKTIVKICWELESYWSRSMSLVYYFLTHWIFYQDNLFVLRALLCCCVGSYDSIVDAALVPFHKQHTVILFRKCTALLWWVNKICWSINWLIDSTTIYTVVHKRSTFIFFWISSWNIGQF